MDDFFHALPAKFLLLDFSYSMENDLGLRVHIGSREARMSLLEPEL